MRKTFRYRLRPTKHQRTTLNRTLDVCRWVYNETLAARKAVWEQDRAYLSLYETNRLLPKWKQSNPELGIVYSQVLQEVQQRVDLAYKGFFRRLKAGEAEPGYPRFKGVGRYQSFTFKQNGFTLGENALRLSKIGDVKVVMHRPLEGQVKTLTLHRDALGNWYALFSCVVDNKILPDNGRAVGVDLGLESYATFSNGEKVPNPRFFRKDEKALARAQRKMSKSGQDTPEREKHRKVVAHIHHRIANRRTDFAHKLSRRLVDEYSLVAFEDLGTQHMVKNHRLAKSISDAAWTKLILFTTYKAEDAGRSVVKVDPRGTSQRCSRCGTVTKKTLSVRVHSCSVCGLEIDRDENAAINVLALGLQSMGTGPRSSTANSRE